MGTLIKFVWFFASLVAKNGDWEHTSETEGTW
jgi:hypothetical protein